MGYFLDKFATELAEGIKAEKKGDHIEAGRRADRAQMYGDLHENARKRRASGQGGKHRAE